MAKGSAVIRVLFIEKEDGWVAQCLDYDIVAQAKTFAELQKELERVIVSHVSFSLEHGREPFAGFSRAPQRYWDAYERSDTRIEDNRNDDRPFIPHRRVTNARELEAA